MTILWQSLRHMTTAESQHELPHDLVNQSLYIDVNGQGCRNQFDIGTAQIWLLGQNTGDILDSSSCWGSDTVRVHRHMAVKIIARSLETDWFPRPTVLRNFWLGPVLSILRLALIFIHSRTTRNNKINNLRLCDQQDTKTCNCSCTEMSLQSSSSQR